MQASHADFLQEAFIFRIENTVQSSATRVVFNDSHPDMQHICLKMWLECQNEIYNTGDLKQRALFLLEGLSFNRRFSGNVCYGIVPLLRDKPDELTCGPLIEKPTFENLLLNRPYALVMQRLKEKWRLDQQLESGKLGNVQGMEFLAQKIADMHWDLEDSLSKFGTPKRIAKKLKFNMKQFRRALDARRAEPQIMAAPGVSTADMTWIKSVPRFLRQLSKEYWYDFKKRHNDGHIRRCHGDLKTSNLWICPPDSFQTQERLVALDCVDFNPEFCNIDTLSDVAMLAVDLEMRLESASISGGDGLAGRQLARHFLQTYLKATGEDDRVWPLLEYYMTEKAMVCTYMSMLYDSAPMLGERYLKVVLAHSQELANVYSPL